jgi:hypothetical protein
MCLYCPTCGVRESCKAREKAIVAFDMMDQEWYDDLVEYCVDNTTERIECSDCHAR